LKQLILFFLSAIPLVVFGQNDDLIADSLEVEVNEIFVTATGIERQLSALPIPGQIISQQDIESSNAITLSDLLEEFGGMLSVSDFGGGEGIQLQGLDSEHILIMVDGFPLIGRQAGSFDLNRVPLGNVKQIEIVKGASSNLYGNEALGGVINVITKDVSSTFSGSASHHYASHNTHHTYAEMAGKTKQVSYGLQLGRLSSSGYEIENAQFLSVVKPWNNYNLHAQLEGQLTKDIALSVDTRMLEQNQDESSFSTLGENQHFEFGLQPKVHVAIGKKWSANWLTNLSSYRLDDRSFDSTGEVVSSSEVKQQLNTSEIQLSRITESIQLRSGLGWRNEQMDRADFSKDVKFNSQHVFGQIEGNSKGHLTYLAGLRFDHHNEYNSQLSPKAALRYELADNMSVKSSLGYGFKAPDFRQLYFAFSSPSIGYSILGYNAVPDVLPQLQEDGQIANVLVDLMEFSSKLSAEKSRSLNIGYEYEINPGLTVELSGFRNDISDLIDTRIIATKTNGQSVFSYRNIDKVFSQGLEFSGTYRPNSAIKTTVQYQYLDSRDKNAVSEFESGDVFARHPVTLQTFRLQSSDYIGLFNRSKHSGSAHFHYYFDQLKADSNVRFKARSSFGLLDSNGNSYLDQYDELAKGYTVLDWAANKRWKSLRLGLGVNNILDYTDGQNLPNESGRTFYSNIKFNF